MRDGGSVPFSTLSWTREATGSAAVAAVRPAQAIMAAPSLLFVATLTVMLFRPPDLQFYSLDRIAFVLLVMVAVLRGLILRQPLWIVKGVTLPMLGLLFRTPTSLRWLETFALIVLAYLSFIAIAFLIGAKALIFPAFILDEGLGIHADRARGPFLQAVANGLTLNMLGLLALDSFRRGRLRGIWALALLAALPVAILATKTRAVWLSFSLSLMVLCFRTSSRRLRRACLGIAAMSTAALVVALSTADLRTSLEDRARERGPVEIRLAVYQAGWQMFLERPFSGWGMNQMPAELASRMSEYRLKAFPVHNTYLEILVEHGIIGLALYSWLVVGLFRVGGRQVASQRRFAPSVSPRDEITQDDPAEHEVVSREFAERDFPDKEFRKMWPILLGVYLLNGTFVVMNYQFVNGLLFTLAGVLAAQNRCDVAAQEYLLAS